MFLKNNATTEPPERNSQLPIVLESNTSESNTSKSNTSENTVTESKLGTVATHLAREDSELSAPTRIVADQTPAQDQDTNSQDDIESADAVDRSIQDSIDVLELGKESLDEVSFRYWVSRLRSNPALLQSALTEYLEDSDIVRARNLAAVLAEVNTPNVLDAAIQLSHATETSSQLAGLELLARLQPFNTHARDNAIDLLATQSDPSLLLATLNVFATPAQAVSAEQRQLLLDHARVLSTHSDANVRALGISTISKWSKDSGNLAATIGLNDPDGAVRAKSAASLINARNPSPESMQGLFTIAANKGEQKTTRQLAMLALSKMALTENDKLRYEALEIELRRTR